MTLSSSGMGATSSSATPSSTSAAPSSSAGSSSASQGSGSSSAAPPPVITGVDPARVLAGGGALPVRLTGTGFTPGMMVLVGGNLVAPSAMGPTTVDVILARAVTLVPGVVRVGLEGAGSSSNTVDLQVVPTPASLENHIADTYNNGSIGSVLVLTNPAREVVQATVRYLPNPAESGTAHSVTVDVPPLGLRVVDTAAPPLGTAFEQFAVEVRSALPILASIWMTEPAHDRLQTHLGQRQLHNQLIMGLGIQDPANFTSYIEVVNPGTQAAQVDITAYPEDGTGEVSAQLTLAPGTQQGQVFPQTLGYMTVEISSDQPVAAHLSVSNGAALKSFAGTGSVPHGEATLMMPFGLVSGSPLTRLALYNPTSSAQTSTLTLFANGTETTRQLPVNPHQSALFTPDTSNTPFFVNTAFCARVDAVDLVGTLITAPPSLMVGDRGRALLAAPATTLLIPMARTSGGFRERVAVCNPSNTNVDLRLTFFTGASPAPTAVRQVEPRSLLVLDTETPGDFPVTMDGWMAVLVESPVPTGAVGVLDGPSGERALVEALTP